MKQSAKQEKKQYRIEIKQDISDRFLATLGKYQKQNINNRIMIEGEFVDQSALFGLMLRLFALHIEVVAVIPENLWVCVDQTRLTVDIHEGE